MTELDKTTEVGKKKKAEWGHYLKIGVTFFITFAACILFFFVVFRFDQIAKTLGTITKAAEPIIVGLILAYLLIPVKERIQKPVQMFLEKKLKKKENAKKWAQRISIFGSIVFLLIIIALLIAILVPAVVTSVMGLIDKLPEYTESFMKWMEEHHIGDSTIATYIEEATREVTNRLKAWAQNDLLPQIQNYVVQITSGVFSALKSVMNFVIGIIVAVYVMSIQDVLVGQSKKIIYAIFPVKKGNLIIDTVRKSNQIFGGFIIGKIVDSAIIGVICYIGCLILQMPSSLLVAVIVGVTNVIPFFGPFIGAIPSVLLVLIQSPIHGLYLAIFILVLQQVDGNIIGPKILGDTTGLSSFWVLFSILVSGGVFGFAGMLLGVPTFAVIYYIMQKIINGRIQKRKLPTNTKEYVELQFIDEKTMNLKYASDDEEENE